MGLIHIADDYYIKPDDYCYTLCQKYFAKDKQGNETEQYRSLTYHGSIAGCIQAYSKQALKSRIEASLDMELPELVAMIREAEEETNRLIEKATGGR